MSKTRAILSGLIPNAFERIVTNSTGVAVSSATQSGRVLLITVETQDVRVRFDSTAATVNTGILLQAGADPFWNYGYNGAAIKFRNSNSTAAVVQVQSFKQFEA